MQGNKVRKPPLTPEEREKEQFIRMTQTPIPKLIMLLGIPTVLNMLVSAFYNLADMFFVSGLGETPMGAVSIVFPLMALLQAVGFTFGMGSGSIVSRLLGKRDKEEADKVSSSAFFTAGVVGIILGIVGIIFIDQIMILLGVSETAFEYAKEYAKYILISAPFLCTSFVMNVLMRSQGKPWLSMIGLVTGNIVNLILDPIFIFAFDMGIKGAAIATLCGQIVGFLILLYLFLSKRTVTQISIKKMSKKASVYGNIILTGLPSFFRQVLSSFCIVLINWTLKDYGDGAIAAFGLCDKVFMVGFSITIGLGQGYQPVLGYNYSAKNYDRVKKAYLFTLVFATAIMSVFSLVFSIFAPNIMSYFLEAKDSIDIGSFVLRTQCICLLMLPCNFLAGFSYQVVGNKIIAILLSIARQGFFFIPATIILPRFLGLLGAEYVQLVTDSCMFLFCIPFTIYFFVSLNKTKKKYEMEKNA